METQQKKLATKEDVFEVCKACKTGLCCRDGVDVDLEEAKRISQLELPIKKPWFIDLWIDPDMPSGWAVETVVRKGRCVFQDTHHRCMIYDQRPHYCREFPLEHGDVMHMLEYLCERSHTIKHVIRHGLHRESHT